MSEKTFLPKMIQEPEVPANWTYEKSVERAKPMYLNWRHMTVEFSEELLIAHKALGLTPVEVAKIGGKAGGRNHPKGSACSTVQLAENRSFKDWCEGVEIPYTTALKWVAALLAKRLTVNKLKQIGHEEPTYTATIDPKDFETIDLNEFKDAAREEWAQFINMEDTPLTHWTRIEVEFKAVKEEVE